MKVVKAMVDVMATHRGVLTPLDYIIFDSNKVITKLARVYARVW